MALSAPDIINPAFEHMKQTLFGPFKFGRWVRLAVVGMLAGEMGMGGCNFPSGGGGGGGSDTPIPDIPSVPTPGGLAFAIGIGILVLLFFVFMIALIYISSRMRFVLFDSVLAKDCHIREYWGRRGPEAFRYFVFQILYSLCAAASALLLIGIPIVLAFAFGWMDSPRDHLLPLILGGVLVALLFVLLLTTLAVIHVLIKDFVVPQMALEGATVAEGWRNMWSMVQEEKVGFAGYLGMKIVLAIAAGVALGIITIVVVLIVLLPVGGIGAIAIIGGGAAGLSWNPVTIAIAIVVGGLVLLAIMFLGALISVPAAVFFPAYSMYFFAERYPALRAALYPTAPPAA